ncbi:endonuclease/exonuclease/phosphatase family protein [Massilia cavernae]|nr:endonuclease/exonuclease/phosphatase family protein [Massilia cavernae]
MQLVLLLYWALLPPAAFGQPAATFNLASYNLRLNVAQDGINAWPKRKELVKSLIRYHDFDVFATQEGLPDQVADLAEMKEFAYVGAGRDDGKHAGEHAAIFYKRSRFSLLRSGDFWLSETPDRPSLGWDASCCKRIVSWAQLHDRNTGRRFFFFSVHFDHQGELARRESAKLMLRKIREIAGGEPVICAGDFNSTPDTEQIRTMQTLLGDAYLSSATPPYGPAGTFNGFRIDAPLESRIDYIFVSAQVKVRKYAALTDSRDGRYLSDHLPVVVQAEIVGSR